MNDVKMLNNHFELVFKFWNGEISEEDFEKDCILYVTKEVDNEMQQDSFY